MLTNAVNIAVYVDSQLFAKLTILVYCDGSPSLLIILESFLLNQEWFKQLNRTERYLYFSKLQDDSLFDP